MNVSKNAEEIAYARCQILGPLLQSEMDPAKRAYEIRKMAEQHQLSERTVRRWLSRYTEDGFRGLMTKSKPAHDRSSSVTEEIVDAAVILRREVPTRSVSDLIRILELEGRIPCGQVKRSTLQDHLEKRGYGARQIAMYNTGSAGASRRFERTGRNELWQADIKYLLVLPATAQRPALQLYTSVFLDDATRLVTGLRVYERQDIRCVMDCFRHAIETNGVPEELYTDNGRQYIGKQLQQTCHKLGIRLMHAKPYAAASKGKVEALNKYLDKFVAEVKLKHPQSAAEVQHELDLWLSVFYQQKIHSALHGRTPEEAFRENRKELRFVTPDTLNFAFTTTEARLVDKTGCISFHSRLWDAGPDLIGLKVTTQYSPENPKELIVSHPNIEPRVIHEVHPSSFCSRKKKVLSDTTATTSRVLDAAAKKHSQQKTQLGATNFRGFMEDNGHV
jgi:transposase InsO family protein